MYDGIELRIATCDDAAALGQLLLASYASQMASAYPPSVLAAVLPLMTQANPTLLASGTFYIAQAGDGVFAGCGGWTMQRPGSGETEMGLAHIRHFAVHPDWLRQGVGRKIYGHCAAEAGKAGANRFECFSSLNAEQFYAALGFVTAGQRVLKMAQGAEITSVVMFNSI